jgi:hypothetical protein
MTAIFFNAMKKEIAVFLLSIIIATAIIVISHSVLQTAIDNKNTQHASLVNTKQRYYTAIERRQLLEKFEARFITLQNAGIAGKEKRLNWVDTISAIAIDEKIPHLKYTIDKQEKIKSPNLKSRYPDIDIFKSTMTLNMQLLHEGDLYTIINNLDKSAKGLFDIQNCSIVRNTVQDTPLLEKATDKNFASVCVLNWYTMQKKTRALPTRRNPNV